MAKKRQPPPAPKGASPQIQSADLGGVAELKEPLQPTADYTIGSWSGMPQYCCTRCPYDTLDLGRMQAHIVTHQPQPHPQPRSSILLADKSGNERPLSPPSPSEPEKGEPVEGGDLVEVELREVSSTTDENGVEHKVYTVKE